MPNCKTHFAAGAGVGLALNLIKQWTEKAIDPSREFDFGEAIAWAAVGGVVGCAADMLEPALHPNHRQSCHSVAAAGLILYGIHGEHAQKLTPGQREFVGLVGYSYLSHLALDSMTKKSLPWV